MIRDGILLRGGERIVQPFAPLLEAGVANRDPSRPLAPGFLFLFAKRKGCRLKRHPLCGKAAGGRFTQAGGRWVAYSNLPHKHTRGCVLPSAQTMTAAPAGAVALSGGCRSSRIRLAERTISAGNTTAPSGW